MHRPITVTIIAANLLALAAPAHAEPAPFMMRALVNGRTLEGQPLAWDDDQIMLLGRDGALYEFNPADAKHSKKTAQAYTGYSAGEMQALARSEFGQRFDISISTHFVVVRPRGRGGEWVRRLEALYSGFTGYMNVRGFQITDPPTHLLAIVFPSRDEYYQYAADQGVTLSPNTLGHYSSQSNRIYMYDEGDSDGDWSSNAETIIHEATHQTAYNVGVHRRFAEQPQWVVEGLAMMFEAPGVWSAASLHTQADRINRYRLNYFRAAAADRPKDWLAQIVASDQPFDTGVLDAYAAGWTLTFYLCETRPQEYSAYLARVAARKPFTKYTTSERMRDFTAAFGNDLALLSAQVDRFVAELP
jgi:Protein of unknown function (DUF1570)